MFECGAIKTVYRAICVLFHRYCGSACVHAQQFLSAHVHVGIIGALLFQLVVVS